MDGGSCISPGDALLHTLREIQPPQEVTKVRTNLRLSLGKGLEVCTNVVLHSLFTVNCGGFRSVWMIPGTHSVPMAYLIKSNYI